MLNRSDREGEQSLKAPALPPTSLNKGCVIMIGKIMEIALSLSVCISSDGPHELERCEVLAKEVRERERTLTRDLHAVAQGDTLSALVRLPFFLQDIAEKLENIVDCCRHKAEEGIILNGTGEAHCQQLLAILIDMMNNLQDAFTTTDTVLVQSIISQGSELSRMLKDFRSAGWLRPRRGPFAAQVIDIYLDILDAIKSANEDVGNICASLLELETTSGVFANAPGQKDQGN
jgi:Na+/phosphate symporter